MTLTSPCPCWHRRQHFFLLLSSSAWWLSLSLWQKSSDFTRSAFSGFWATWLWSPPSSRLNLSLNTESTCHPCSFCSCLPLLFTPFLLHAESFFMLHALLFWQFCPYGPLKGTRYGTMSSPCGRTVWKNPPRNGGCTIIWGRSTSGAGKQTGRSTTIRRHSR